MHNRRANLCNPAQSRNIQRFQRRQQKTNLPNLFPVGQHEKPKALRGGRWPRSIRSCARTLMHTHTPRISVTFTKTVTSFAQRHIGTAGSLENSGAGEGNRTLLVSLGSLCLILGHCDQRRGRGMHSNPPLIVKFVRVFLW